jgi:hypothetical protein
VDRLGRNAVDCLNTGYKMRDEKKMLVTYGHDGAWDLDDFTSPTGSHHVCGLSTQVAGSVAGPRPSGGLAPYGADHPLAVGVHPRGLRRALEDRDLLGLEDSIERLAVPAVAVTQQEA